ncbi:uncharacterized protein [Malus domestica]|uniref:uncharacterized protein isoform X1 n=1 Tax=Malus domestica TaxID=3750 RepID=UPI003975E961
MVTIEELGYLDPDLYKDNTFLCKASIKRFNTSYEWWYAACPTCAKQMYKDPTIGQLMCQKHTNQMPTPWYKVFLVFEDETNEINALIIGKLGEKVFACHAKIWFTIKDQHIISNCQCLRQQFRRPLHQLKNQRNAQEEKRFNEESLFLQRLKTEEVFEADVQDFHQVPIKLLKKNIFSNKHEKRPSSIEKKTRYTKKSLEELCRNFESPLVSKIITIGPVCGA